MRSGVHRLRGIFLGGVTAITSSAIVLGSFVLAFTEGGRSFALAPSPTIQPTSLPTRLLPTFSPPSATPTSLPSLPPTATPTSQATPTATPCPPPPDDWMQITIEDGDNLRELAVRYGTTKDDLFKFNCLALTRLEPGTTLYVPGFTPTTPPEECVPRYDWEIYIVQPRDTLSSLSRLLGVSVKQLMVANCLTSDKIRAGQQLYVPSQPVPPRPSPTGTSSREAPPIPR